MADSGVLGIYCMRGFGRNRRLQHLRGVEKHGSQAVAGGFGNWMLNLQNRIEMD